MIKNQLRNVVLFGALASAALTSQGFAHPGPNGASTTINDFALYGVSAPTNELIRYQFSDATYTPVGPIRFHNGSPAAGVGGMAHIPGHLNIFGFWADPSDGNSKLVYINSQTAVSTVVGNHLGPGLVTGGTVAWLEDNNQLSHLTGSVSGSLNINPSNNPANEFSLTKDDGTLITRDDLHQNSVVDSTGTYYNGACTYVWARPKGNGNQNTIAVNGVVFPVDNSKAYEIYGSFTVRLYNDNINANGKAMGQWWLEFQSSSTTAAISEASNGGVFAIQTIEIQEDPPVDFDIVGGHVVPTEDFALKLKVLGAAITYGGQYNIPVTTQLKIGATTVDPFGSFTQPVGGNVNDALNPRHIISPNIYPANTPISVAGTSWVKKKSWYSGNSNSHWKKYLTVNSDMNTPSVLVLRHGDAVPNITPFMNQNNILDFIRDYVDAATGTVVLDENQAIFLYELGTTNLASAAADFQDLVVLVTLAKDPADLIETEDDDAAAGPASRLLKVNPITGGTEQLMTLDRVYNSLASATGGKFYACYANNLYELDPIAQTETLVGTLPNSDMIGFEAAGSTYCVFTSLADELMAIDILTGQQIGTSMDIGATNLQAIVFILTSSEPNLGAFD